MTVDGTRIQVTMGFGTISAGSGDLSLALFAGSGLTSISFSGIPSPGTYAFANGIGQPGILTSSGGVLHVDNPTGSITISSITASRVRGHFSASFPGGDGKPPLVISEAEFDLGIRP